MSITADPSVNTKTTLATPVKVSNAVSNAPVIVKTSQVSTPVVSTSVGTSQVSAPNSNSKTIRQESTIATNVIPIYDKKNKTITPEKVVRSKITPEYIPNKIRAEHITNGEHVYNNTDQASINNICIKNPNQDIIKRLLNLFAENVIKRKTKANS